VSYVLGYWMLLQIVLGNVVTSLLSSSSMPVEQRRRQSTSAWKREHCWR